MWLISGFSGSSRGRGRGSWDLAGAHEGAAAARAESSGPGAGRATGRLRVRGSAHRSMRAIVSGAVSLRQLVFHPSAGHPLAGCGLQRSSSASLCAEPIVLNVPRTPLRRVFSVRRYRDTRPVHGPRLVRKFAHCAPRSSRSARCANREPLNVSQVRLRNRTVDLLFTIWRQGGHRRSLTQVGRSMRARLC